LGVVAQRFVAEMIYGIQASGSVLLTEVARTLQESIAVRKTHMRLSRNLQRPELEGVVQDNVLRLAAPQVGRDTLLVIDPSDVAKKYAKKMEYLATVRDGSAHELSAGYWTLHVMGAELGTERVVPLYQRLYSSNAPGFVSENDEVLRAVDAVRAHVGDRGLWVMDRGGDRIHLFEPLLDRKARFLFRLVGNRDVVVRGETLLASEAVARVRRRFTQTIVKIVDGREETYTLRFGAQAVRLPGREGPLYLVVIDGFGPEPLMLLTTEDPGRSFKRLWRLVRAYLRRWAIEETIRYVKPAMTSRTCVCSSIRDCATCCPCCLPSCSSPPVYWTMIVACVSWPNTSSRPPNASSAYRTSSITPWPMACAPCLPGTRALPCPASEP